MSYDITGNRYGYLVALECVGSNNRKEKLWRCLCDCGNETIVPSYRLRHGGVRSCGCHQRDCNYRSKKAKNNQRLYRVYRNMRRRCEYKKDPNYPNYGGRGIKVCQEWNKFDHFCDWALENGYDSAAEYGVCTIDRIDTNKDYSPDNCRFVNLVVQANNRRTNHVVAINGQKKTLTQIEREHGLYHGAMNTEMKKGKSPEEALSALIARKGGDHQLQGIGQKAI